MEIQTNKTIKMFEIHATLASEQKGTTKWRPNVTCFVISDSVESALKVFAFKYKGLDPQVHDIISRNRLGILVFDLEALKNAGIL